MSIYINNTLSRKKEKFVPCVKKKVKIYVCGPTVYDVPHIGHVRSAIVFEVVRRFFEFKGYKVNFIKNITDIDDKIIKAASEKGSISETSKIAKQYEEEYHKHMALAGVRPADKEPRVTEHIQDIIKCVKKIIDAGYGYESDGSVYFSVKKLSDYGMLSGQNMDKVGRRCRIEKEKDKKNSFDFVLWKKSKKGEPSWKSPWGIGRPGWHIECTAMSMKYFGKEFDIHGGGIDLVFPHHENEIAQAKALGGKFAKYWMHNGLISINGEKMSKSLGNYITITDVLKKNSADALNILFLSAHYSSPIDFTWEKLNECEKASERISILKDKINLLLKDFQKNKVKYSKNQEKFKDSVKNIFREFVKSLEDDFNTAAAMSKIFDLINQTNKFISSKKKLQDSDKCMIMESKQKIDVMTHILCISGNSFKKEFENKDRQEILKILISIRESARKQKAFNLADEIREKLKDIGINLEDTPEGTKYRMTYNTKK